MKYVYFVSFTSRNKDGLSFGNTEIAAHVEITRIELVGEIQRRLAETIKSESVTVMFYQLLRTEALET